MKVFGKDSLWTIFCCCFYSKWMETAMPPEPLPFPLSSTAFAASWATIFRSTRLMLPSCGVAHPCYHPFIQGCLTPIEIVIPELTILNPSEEVAVIGGNVLTSQRVVDVVFAAFSVCAASQVMMPGCSSTFLFRTSNGHYQQAFPAGLHEQHYFWWLHLWLLRNGGRGSRRCKSLASSSLSRCSRAAALHLVTRVTAGTDEAEYIRTWPTQGWLILRFWREGTEKKAVLPASIGHDSSFSSVLNLSKKTFFDWSRKCIDFLWQLVLEVNSSLNLTLSSCNA